MIRLIKWRLIVPRGDTGTFTIPALAAIAEGDLAIFSVFDPLTHLTVLEKTMTLENGMLSIKFEHKDTVDLRPAKYQWDIKLYTKPVYNEDGHLIDGEEIQSYYAGYKMPIFEVKEVAQNVNRPY